VLITGQSHCTYNNSWQTKCSVVTELPWALSWAEPRPKTDLGVFWRPQNAPFLCLYGQIWGGRQFVLASPYSRFWGDKSTPNAIQATCNRLQKLQDGQVLLLTARIIAINSKWNVTWRGAFVYWHEVLSTAQVRQEQKYRYAKFFLQCEKLKTYCCLLDSSHWSRLPYFFLIVVMT